MEPRQCTETKLIEIEKLVRSSLNARLTEKTNGLGELKASILAHGLMQNLVVTAHDNGRYHVIAGGRRLEAIRSLREEGLLPDGYAVPCQVVAEEHAEELSLAENVVRVAMHPADEFEAFAGLVEKGLTTAEVAERFGVTEKHVLQRLKLARVAPELVDAYRAGSIDLECLMAFTVTDDRARQLSVAASLQGWQKGNASHIRGRLTEKMVNAVSKFAKFVGLEAYEAAGGKTRSDLFGEEVFLEDPEVLDSLVKESLSEVRRRLEVEGWGWVEVNIERDYTFIGKCGRIHARPFEPPPELVAERTRLQSELDAIREKEDAEESPSDETHDRVEVAEEKLEEIESRLREFVSFDPKKMKFAGCYVTIDHGGRLFIERGLIKKKDEKKLAKSKKGGKAASNEPGEQISEALRHDLKVYRLQVAQLEIASHPDIAFDLLVFHAALSVLGSHFFHDGPEVRFGSNIPAAPRSIDTTVAAERFESFERRLSREWLKADTQADQFEQFRKLTDEEKRALLAYCTASALRPKLDPNAGEDVSAYDIALSLTGANVADSWRPSKENYLGRLTREQLLAIGVELLGKEWALRCGGFKKGKLAEILGAAFSSPAEHGETPEQVEKLKSWLPSGMAFGVTLEPRPVKAKKTKKAA